MQYFLKLPQMSMVGHHQISVCETLNVTSLTCAFRDKRSLEYLSRLHSTKFYAFTAPVMSSFPVYWKKITWVMNLASTSHCNRHFVNWHLHCKRFCEVISSLLYAYRPKDKQTDGQTKRRVQALCILIIANAPKNRTFQKYIF